MTNHGNIARRIQAWQTGYEEQTASLFTQAVHAIEDGFYNSAQKHAWAPRPFDLHFWIQRLANSKPYLSFHGTQLIGFIELRQSPYIDCLYVHPDWQRQGVAQALYKHIETIAIDRGDTELVVDASAPAMPFFKKNNFQVIKENHLEVRGQLVTNWRMRKTLTPPPKP